MADAYRFLVRPRHIACLVAGLALVAGGLVGQTGPARADAVKTRYIVSTYTSDGTDQAVSRLTRVGTRPSHRYSRVFNGFATSLTPSQVGALSADPRVRSIVPDQPMSIESDQSAAPWGLDRLNQRDDVLDGRYSYQTTGAGVTVFQIDTAVRLDHADLGGRAVSGYDFVDRDADANERCARAAGGYGHGTHVAGTILGSTYGVSKQARLVALRVLDCDGAGWTSDFLSALQYAVDHKPTGPAVVNISAGGDRSASLDAAVAATVDAGIAVVVAAGNENQSACNSSPARAPAALTVAASTSSDDRASYSDYGSCVDLFAPGSSVRSAWPTSSTATATLSGTSMATPHVTGAVARYLQAYPSASPAAVRTALLGDATSGAISGAGAGTPDKLLYLRGSTTGAPTSVAATRLSTGSIALGWEPPYGFGSPTVTGYRLTRSGHDAAGAAFAPIDLGPGSRSFTFSRLGAGTAYTVSVRALSSAGAGSTAARAVAKLALPGRGRVGLASAGPTGDGLTSITARWNSPGPGGAVASYSLQVKREATSAISSVTAGSSKRSLQVSKLAKSAYVVRVRAVNAAGSGAWSSWSARATAR